MPGYTIQYGFVCSARHLAEQARTDALLVTPSSHNHRPPVPNSGPPSTVRWPRLVSPMSRANNQTRAGVHKGASGSFLNTPGQGVITRRIGSTVFRLQPAGYSTFYSIPFSSDRLQQPACAVGTVLARKHTVRFLPTDRLVPALSALPLPIISPWCWATLQLYSCHLFICWTILSGPRGTTRPMKGGIPATLYADKASDSQPLFDDSREMPRTGCLPRTKYRPHPHV
jgi:hypothetical protein